MTQASALPDSATEMSPPIVVLHGVCIVRCGAAADMASSAHYVPLADRNDLRR